MNPRPIHSTRRNLANLAYLLSRLVLGAFGAALVLACYIAICWLAYAASYNPQTLIP